MREFKIDLHNINFSGNKYAFPQLKVWIIAPFVERPRDVFSYAEG